MWWRKSWKNLLSWSEENYRFDPFSHCVKSFTSRERKSIFICAVNPGAHVLIKGQDFRESPEKKYVKLLIVKRVICRLVWKEPIWLWWNWSNRLITKASSSSSHLIELLSNHLRQQKLNLVEERHSRCLIINLFILYCLWWASDENKKAFWMRWV